MADLELLQSRLPMGGTADRPDKLPPGRLAGELSNKLGNKLRFNELTLRAEIDGTPVADHLLQHFYLTLGQRGWQIEKGAARDALLYAARLNSYHPIREYLHQLEVDPDVQPVDLDSLASTYLGTNDPLCDAMLAATLIGAVARVLQPGCKFDTCTVLRGRQGIFKSTFWKALASPSWFCDTPNDDKDLKLAIQTCWIYELAELETKTGNKEAGAIKALLSSSVDNFRVPYGAGIEDHPRPSILVGSCNRDDFLRDETGSRRFWVVPLLQDPDKGEHIDIELVRRDRDRIWKTALLAYRSGRLPILSQQDQLESNRRNRGFEPEHIWLAPLSEWVKQCGLTSFSTAEALIQSGLREKDKFTTNDQRIAASVLRDLGWQQDQFQTRQDQGKRARLWRRASDVSDPPVASEASQSHCETADQGDLSQMSDAFLGFSSTDTFLGSTRKTSESSETTRHPWADLREGTPVELIQPDGRWQEGWKVADVVTTNIGTRVRILGPDGESRNVPADQVRVCQ